METVVNAQPAVPPEDDLVMALLQEHVPLALLCDLSEPEGPSSREIMDAEGEPEQRWWES